MHVVLLAESVNPVYRRRRIAKVVQTQRKHAHLAKHWADVSDKLDAKGRKISSKYFKEYGNNFMKWPKHVQKQHNAEHDANNARRSNAEETHSRNVRKRVKAYKISKGSYELPDGSTKHRLIPSNPLRKNRDETSGKHQRTMQLVRDVRAHDKEVKEGSRKWAVLQALTARKPKKD